MNRTTLFGIALFLAVLGIAVMGSDNQANAGRHGCAGVARAHGGCFGMFKHRNACHGISRGCAGEVDYGCVGARRQGGLLARKRARHGGGCAGVATNCCGQVAAPVCEPVCCEPAPCCGAVVEPSCGGAVIEEAPAEAAPTEAEVAPEVPPAPAAEEAEGSA